MENHVDLFKKLKVGEAVVIECQERNPFSVLHQTAKRIGMKISIRKLDGSRFRVKRIGKNEDWIFLRIARIDKNQLEFLYAKEKISQVKIGNVFGVHPTVVAKALKFYKIPRRDPIKLPGKYVTPFRNLEVGECREVECLAKYPTTNLHEIARRIGIKISVRRRGDGKFKVTRVK